MIRSLLKLGALLVLGILVYNYFYGTEAEQEQSRRIFSKGKELVSDSWNLLKSEREKFREGKYDDAVAKVETLFTNLKNTAEKLSDSGALEKLSQLEQQRQEIEKALNAERDDGQAMSSEDKARIERDFNSMMNDTEVLMEDLERQEQQRQQAPR
jgi:hypothetical protein